MSEVALHHGDDPREWLEHAEHLFARGVRPEAVVWRLGHEMPDLFAQSPSPAPTAPSRTRPLRLPKEFLSLVRRVICHESRQRHAVLYRVAVRLQREPRLLALASDPDIRQLNAWDREVRRAAHKMKAFVRFQHRPAEDVYVSWFDPGHPVLRTLAPFFVRRFASLRWIIVTPHASASWDGSTLRFGPGAERERDRGTDPFEALWKTYYASIFNPARVMVKAMKREMPQRYWRDLPEAELIPGLIRDAGARTLGMLRSDDETASPHGSA